MNRIKLVHLTFVGDDISPASIQFAPGASVIHGPSDTGKSFVLAAISYMLGGEKLKQISQLEKYSFILLGLELGNGTEVTLRRRLSGGAIGLFIGNLADPLAATADESLGWQHSSKPNISSYLLKEIGLQGRRIRKNLNNATLNLTFRYVVHLCLVGEEKIQSERSPVIHSPTLQTADKSAFKVLLQGTDDSALTEVISSTVVNADKRMRQSVIDDLIAEINLELTRQEIPADVFGALAKLNSALQIDAVKVDRLSDERDSLSTRRLTLKRRLARTETALGETKALQARFGLLLAQYDSDLERLELLREADDIFSLFTETECALCGAESSHQKHGVIARYDQDLYQHSIVAEKKKTHRLRVDLLATLGGIQLEEAQLQTVQLELETEIQRVSTDLISSDRLLRPEKSRVSQTLEHRSQIEHVLVLQRQIESLGARRAQYADEAVVEVAENFEKLSIEAIRELSVLIAGRLEAWGVPNAATAVFSGELQDIVLERQERSAHGKGVRSLLHAAFTLSLAQYCFDRELPHPGFVVLDSPLVAYRPPDQKNPEGPSAAAEGLSLNVVEAFYRDVENNFSGQVVILENTSPEDFLSSEASNIKFSKASDGERYGLFPANA